MWWDNFKYGGSYTDSPDWWKKKKVTVTPKNDDRCFQYVVTIVLGYNEIVKKPSKNNKTFIFL